MLEPKPDLTPRPTGFKPYPLDAITQHAPPGTRMLEGKYPVVTGLEHDEMGHPTASPRLHAGMTAKRRKKYQQLADELPMPKVHGDPEGEVLLVGWGSTYGPIYEAVNRARARGERVSALHLRHLNPLQRGLDSIVERFREIGVVERNAHDLYG